MQDHKYYLEEWNTKHCEFTNDPSVDRNMSMANYCEGVLLKAKEAYYNSGESIMLDITYDWFEDRLKILNIDSKILDKVGS